MPACPHCKEYYFGNPDACPKCHYHFKERRVIVPEALRAKQLAENEARERRNKEAQERAIREKNIKDLTILQNPRYEYATEFLPDDSSGCPDQRLLNRTLSRYAEEGWRLHSVAVNEIGRNSHSSGYGGVSNGTNATIDVTVLIFERCIRPAEY